MAQLDQNKSVILENSLTESFEWRVDLNKNSEKNKLEEAMDRKKDFLRNERFQYTDFLK